MWKELKVFLGFLPRYKKGDILHKYDDREFTPPTSIEILEVGKRNYLYKFTAFPNGGAYEQPYRFIDILYYKPNE